MVEGGDEEPIKVAGSGLHEDNKKIVNIRKIVERYIIGFSPIEQTYTLSAITKAIGARDLVKKLHSTRYHA